MAVRLQASLIWIRIIVLIRARGSCFFNGQYKDPLFSGAQTFETNTWRTFVGLIVKGVYINTKFKLRFELTARPSGISQCIGM